MHALTKGLDSQARTPHLLLPHADGIEKQTAPSYAEQISELSREKIYKGVSTQLLEAWIDDIRSGLKNKKIYTVLSWESILSGHVTHKEIAANPEKDAFNDPPLTHFSTPELWGASYQQLREIMLWRLCYLDKDLFIPENHPAKLVLHKLTDSVIEQFASEKNMQNKSYFPVFMEKSDFPPSFLCFKTLSGWCCGDFDSQVKQPFKVVRVNINKTKTLLIDEKQDIVEHPATILSAHPDPITGHVMIIQVNFLCYSGSAKVFQSQKNSFEITAKVDFRDSLHRLQEMKDTNLLNTSAEDRLNQEQLNTCFKAFQTTYSIFSRHIFEKWLDHNCDLETFQKCNQDLSKAAPPQFSVVIPFFEPQSQSDKLEIIYRLLMDLCKKSIDHHIAEISYIAEQLKPTFSIDEIDALMKNKGVKKMSDGTLEVTPQAILDKLCKDTSKKLRQSREIELAKIEKKAEEISIEKEEKSEGVTSTAEKMEERERVASEKAAEKVHKRKLHKQEQRKMEKKASAGSELIDEEYRPSLKLSSGERATVNSIYQGNPIKSKEFTELAIGLLQKKAEEMKAKISTKVKGSHFKFHLRKEDGSSSGMTLVIPHGKKKDLVGFSQVQKDMLDHIFAL
jgi:hypothetical protein